MNWKDFFKFRKPKILIFFIIIILLYIPYIGYFTYELKDVQCEIGEECGPFYQTILNPIFYPHPLLIKEWLTDSPFPHSIFYGMTMEITEDLKKGDMPSIYVLLIVFSTFLLIPYWYVLSCIFYKIYINIKNKWTKKNSLGQ